MLTNSFLEKRTGFFGDLNTTEFLYDVYGRRIVKDSDGVIHKYVFDNEDILFEFDNDDNLVSQFTHGPGIDEPVEIIQNNQNYYYHVDGLGSITGISNSNGEIVQSYAYSSFGETKVYDQAGTLIDPTQMQVKSPYGYTSREWDFETEKYQYRARDYTPSLGRFLTEDPIGFNGGDANFYRYVRNNPLYFKDAFGLKELRTDQEASVLNTDQGIQMIINSYVNQAKENVGNGANVYQLAHGYAQDYREVTKDNSLALSSAEHYLWARGETLAWGDKQAFIQFVSTTLYTPLKAILKVVPNLVLPQFALDYKNNMSPPSITQMKWGYKGVYDGISCP